MREKEMEYKIGELLEKFNDEVYNSDELWEVERHNEGE
jgi:hypothetical protein